MLVIRSMLTNQSSLSQLLLERFHVSTHQRDDGFVFSDRSSPDQEPSLFLHVGDTAIQVGYVVFISHRAIIYSSVVA